MTRGFAFAFGQALSYTKTNVAQACLPQAGLCCSVQMLKIGQLAQIKSDSPYVYEALTQLVNGVNAVGRATGVDPSGAIAAPSPIGSLNVTAADGIFDLAITDNSTVNRGIFYFAESDTTPAFSQPYVHFLGSSRNLRISIGNQTLYWRAYSQYLGSETSQPVAFGTPPTAVTSPPRG